MNRLTNRVLKFAAVAAVCGFAANARAEWSGKTTVPVAMRSATVESDGGDFPSVRVLHSFRPITVVNTEALVSGETTTAELSFGASTYPRAEGAADKLYVACGMVDGYGDPDNWESVAFVGTVPATETGTTCELPPGFGTTYTQLAFFFVGSTDASSDLYRQEGLIGQWDGLDNAGRGTHSDAPETWVDLTGNHALETVGSPLYGANCVTFDESTDGFRGNSPLAIDAIDGESSVGLTVEYFLKPDKVVNDGVLFSLGYSDPSHRTLEIREANKYPFFACIEFRQSTWKTTTCGATLGQPVCTATVIQRPQDRLGNAKDCAIFYNDTTGTMAERYRQDSGGTAVLTNLFALGGGNIFNCGGTMDLYAVRLYDRPLSLNDLAANAQLDKLRFTEGVTVTNWIGFSETLVRKPSVWEYDRHAGTLTDGDWALRVTENNGELTVTGSAIDGRKILDLAMPVASGETIVSVGANAFNENAALIDPDHSVLVKFPKTLRSLGDYAFYGCLQMRCEPVVNFENLMELGSYAFFYCVNITSAFSFGTAGPVTLGKNSLCSGDNNPMHLSSVTFGDGVTDIPEKLCFWCTSLTNVVFPRGLKTIGASAFQMCERAVFNTLDLPSLTGVGEKAFYGCSEICPPGLVNLCSVRAMGNMAFYACHAMTNDVVIGTQVNGPITLGVSAFQSYTDNQDVPIRSMTIGEGATAIPNYFCRNCDRLEELSLPSTVVSIGAEAFRYTHALGGTVDLGPGLNQMNQFCFGHYRTTSQLYPLTIRFHNRPATLHADSFANHDGALLRFYIPRHDETWRAALDAEGAMTRWADITDQATKDAYAANFPDGVMPRGRLNKTVDSLPSGSWIVLWTPPEAKKGTMLFVR